MKASKVEQLMFLLGQKKERLDQKILKFQDTGIDPVKLKGKNGQYFARISFTGETPPEVTVTN